MKFLKSLLAFNEKIETTISVCKLCANTEKSSYKNNL